MEDKRTISLNKIWRHLEKVHALIMLAEQVGRDIDYELFADTDYPSAGITCVLLDLGDLKDQVEKLKKDVFKTWLQSNQQQLEEEQLQF